IYWLVIKPRSLNSMRKDFRIASVITERLNGREKDASHGHDRLRRANSPTEAAPPTSQKPNRCGSDLKLVSQMASGTKTRIQAAPRMKPMAFAQTWRCKLERR